MQTICQIYHYPIFQNIIYQIYLKLSCSDVEGIEHAMSHAIPKSGGMALFFPFISVMLLVGNVKMGLAVIFQRYLVLS